MIINARLRNALAASTVVLAMSSPAWCFETPAELLDNFTHYSLIAKVDLAVANAQALIDSGITDQDLALLLDEGKVTLTRFEDAVARAQMLPELEAVASDLARRVEAGRLDMARDSKRIDEAINMLTGTLRQKQIAKNRLIAAKEYAVPALLKQITEGKEDALRVASQDMLNQIGGPAVAPLCAALPHLTGPGQRVVCDVLGTVKHPSAAPYLRELSLNETADGPAREAAARALANLGVNETNLSKLYSDLARQYFDGHESLVPFPGEPTNNIWSYDNFTGLSPMPVPTEIYSEVMAMRTASRSVWIDRNNSTGLSLFVAANLKRENDLPEGSTDPIYGENKYTPEFYATVFGTQICLDVLALAIDKFDTPLVRDAIAALAKSTGGANLFTRGQSRQPLLEALSYPDRRVQYEAALTLGRALPQQPFTGDYSVVPILASAVRAGNKSLALVIADDPETRQVTGSELEQLGFQLVGSGASVAEVQADITKAVGIDLIVVRMPGAEQAKDVVESLRAIRQTSATPVLLMQPAVDQGAIELQYRDDRRVKYVRSSVTGEQLAQNIDAVMTSASGGRITETEAEQYAIYALGALEDIAISRNTAYSIADAESALIDAMDTRTGGTRMLVAKILALINSDLAQRKLFDAALAANEDEKVELLGHLADSIRLFGDRAEKRHLDALIDLIGNSAGEVAEAAATVHGALNLPASDAVKLIPQG